MTVEVRVPRQTYLGNGITTEFEVPFRFLNASDLEVATIDALGSKTVLVLDADYTVIGGATDDGGTVVTDDAPALGVKLRILRKTPHEQPTDYIAEGNFPAETHELNADRSIMIVQEETAAIDALAARVPILPDGETISPPIGPSDERIRTVMGFNTEGLFELLTMAGLAVLIGPYLASGLKGDPGGSVGDDAGLFIQLASLKIGSGVSRIRTAGHSAIGAGAGDYVADDLADASLAAQFPLFCKPDATGRYWRALADEEGLVSVETGGVIGTDREDNSINHQPGIQQALDYAIAIGARGIRFTRAFYSLWCPLRNPASQDPNLDQSGIPIVIRARLEMRSAAGGTTFKRRKNDGSDPAVFAGTQLLDNGRYWRGGMFFVVGLPSSPADYSDRAGLTLRGIWDIDGGIPISATPGGVAGTNNPLNPDGSGWDVRDKGIWCAPDKHSGDIVFDGEIRLGGFRGELLYQGGLFGGSIYQYGHLELHNTDGDGFNPGPIWSEESGEHGGTMRMQSVRLRKCYQALEGATGWGGWIEKLVIEDCTQCGGLLPGVWVQAPQPTGLPFPILDLYDVRVERSTVFRIFRGTRIANLFLLQTTATFGQSNIPCYGSEVGDCTVMVDTANQSDGIAFNGTSGAGTKGTYSNRVRHLHVSRTPYALTNGYTVANPCTYVNSLGDNNFVDRITGYSTNPPFARVPGSITDYHVGFGDIGGLKFQNAQSGQNVETTPAIAVHDPYIVLSTTATSGSFEYTMPAMAGLLPKGSRRTLFSASDATLKAIPTNTRNQFRTLHKKNRELSWEWDGSAWQLRGPKPDETLTAVKSFTWGLIAAGEVSAEQTLTLPGIDNLPYRWEIVAIPNVSPWPPYLQVRARISDADEISVAVANLDGSGGHTPAAGNVTIHAIPRY